MLNAVFDVVILLLMLATWIIVIQAVLSWLVAFNVINTSNDAMRGLLDALDRITEPLYRPIRRVMPDFGGIDFSPIVVILLFQLLIRLIRGLQTQMMMG